MSLAESLSDYTVHTGGEMNMTNNQERFAGIASDCYTCVLNQAHSAARFAELSEEQTQRVLETAKAGLEDAKTQPILVQHVIRRVADAIIRERGAPPGFDIYAEVKEHSNTLAMEYAQKLRGKIRASETPIETGLQVAAAGNIIDFGAKNHGALNLDKELQSLEDIPFARYDVAALKTALAQAHTLLYLCDNSGEIVFDTLLMQTLQQTYPDLQIIAALRDKPIINDATLEDAHAVGLDRVVTTTSSGSIYPGTVLPETTPEFQALFASADVVLSKGQGNFETLLPWADARVFFLLRIKCEYMAALADVEKNSLVLMQGQRSHA